MLTSLFSFWNTTVTLESHSYSRTPTLLQNPTALQNCIATQEPHSYYRRPQLLQNPTISPKPHNYRISQLLLQGHLTNINFPTFHFLVSFPSQRLFMVLFHLLNQRVHFLRKAIIIFSRTMFGTTATSSQSQSMSTAHNILVFYGCCSNYHRLCGLKQFK